MYALVLSSNLDYPDQWICHCLKPTIEDIHQLNCFPPESLYLPRNRYEVNILPEIIHKASCVTGDLFPCQIIELKTVVNIPQFNL